ncbi:hypothetical protein E2C01_101280 [Portunus trituberculatus]|uniref:Uncharacterized protein n=1 Tax=Portunus trituberculatus TaxID=210409 RepID=A0A5B7K5A9_PORTR|nr:hypothetical protein [Portunus trituberculatus]
MQESEGEGGADALRIFGDGRLGLRLVVAVVAAAAAADGDVCPEAWPDVAGGVSLEGVARAAASLPSVAMAPSVANIPSVAIIPRSVSQHRTTRPPPRTPPAPRVPRCEAEEVGGRGGWWLSPPWLDGGGASPRRQLTSSTDTNCLRRSRYWLYSSTSLWPAPCITGGGH